MSAGGNFSAWITSTFACAAASASSRLRASITSFFSGALFRRRAATLSRGSSGQKVRCSGKSRSVSDRPSRCMVAPPARMAATEKAFVPGVFFLVQATQISGATARAASTMSRAADATPDQVDQGLRHFPAAQQRARRTSCAQDFGARGEELAVLRETFDPGASEFKDRRRFG